MFHLRKTWLMVSLLFVLAACGGSNTGGNNGGGGDGGGGGGGGDAGGVLIVSTKVPTQEPTQAPTQRPTATTEPTTAPTRASDLVTIPVDMSDLQTYTYDNDLFSIDIPSSWIESDNSTEQEILVRFIDEYENGVILVNLFDYGTPADSDELTTLLNNYLDSQYSVQDGYSRNDAVVQNDGSVLVSWGYDFSSGTQVARLLGNSFIEQKDTTISLLSFAIPEEQFADLQDVAIEVINSYTYNPVTEVANGGTSSGDVDANGWGMVEITDLETYTYDTGLFSIDIPEGWELQDNSTSGEANVLWLDPTQNALIVVDIFETDAASTSPEDLEELLRSYLEQTFSSYPDFELGDVVEQSDGSLLIVWSYTADASGLEGMVLGNSFIEQRGSYISLLTLLVPDEQFENLMDMTNDILNSYVIDTSALLP